MLWSQVEGVFNEQDAVLLCDGSGRELGRGLTNFTSEELEAGKVGGCHGLLRGFG